MSSRFDQKAVRRGNIYCAPWCGANCTWQAFQKATRDAAALALELGEGWTPDVWENCGWHYKVVRGVLEVSPTLMTGKIKGYTCFVQTRPQFIGKGKTALASVKSAAAKFNAVVDALLDSFSVTRKGLAQAAVKSISAKSSKRLN